MIVGRLARLLEIIEFDPEDFSSTISDGLDKPQKMEFMSSSHTPYILNRLSTSLNADDENGGEGEGGSPIFLFYKVFEVSVLMF